MKNYYTWLFYGIIGLVAGLSLFLVFYWHLRLNSSIAALIINTFDKPLYFWPYVLFTLGSTVLFGINISLLVYRLRKFGFPSLRQGIGQEAGAGLGSLVGIAAAACPVCGSFLLSLVGITGGLAAFPFGGLELKALSFGFLALPAVLTTRQLRRFECGEEACPAPKNPSLKEKELPTLLFLIILLAVLLYIGARMLKEEPYFLALTRGVTSSSAVSQNNPLYDEVVAKVLPEKGFQSKIHLGDSMVGLIENGVIDKKKFADIYSKRGSLPKELADVLEKPSDKPILLTRENANYYVNLLWALGLSNYMSTNMASPINGKSLFNFASTGGWNLGRQENGGAYFNKFEIVKLTTEQEAQVTKIAKNTYRPCCNNSTFYQDCNHGSALLGLIELGASQGLSEDELYREALAFNSFWFPQNYIQTALYFKINKNTNWENVNAKEVLGYNYSAISGWSKNVQTEIAKIPNLLPQTKGGAGCGV